MNFFEKLKEKIKEDTILSANCWKVKIKSLAVIITIKNQTKRDSNELSTSSTSLTEDQENIECMME